jgi:hypothetical protein
LRLHGKDRGVSESVDNRHKVKAVRVLRLVRTEMVVSAVSSIIGEGDYSVVSLRRVRMETAVRAVMPVIR